MPVLLLIAALGCGQPTPGADAPGDPATWRPPQAPAREPGWDLGLAGSVPRQGGWVDLTGDGSPEVVVESDLLAPGVGAVGRTVSVWSFASGAKHVLFEDSVVWSGSDQEVRVAQVRLAPLRISRVGVDYLLPSRCRAFALPGPDSADRRCVERREEVWIWSEETEAWLVLRRIDGERVRAVPRRGVALRDRPDPAGGAMRDLRPGEDLLVAEVLGWRGDATTADPPWFRVVCADGAEGWVAAPDLRFADPFLEAMVQGPREALDPYPWIRW